MSSSDPDTALALIHQGWNHLQLQRPLAAWASWQRALRIEPGSRAAQQALAAWESAMELPAIARTVLRFQPLRNAARRDRWNARLEGRGLEALTAAAQAFAALVDDDPTDAPALFNHALCMAWMGRNTEAIASLDRAVRLQAADAFDRAVESWMLAEVLRQGGGAEPLADSLRYVWVVDWHEGETAKLFAQVSGLQPMPDPRDPITADHNFPEAQVFEWLDLPIPEASSAPSAATELPRLLATVVITPRSLRLSSPVAETLEELHEPLLRAIGDPSRPIRREASPLPLSLLDADVWTFRLPRGQDTEVARSLTRAAVEHFFEDLWIHIPRLGLDDRTPLEASRAVRGGDAVARAKLTAVIRLREQLGERHRTKDLYQGYPFDRLRRRLVLNRDDPATVDPDDSSCMDEVALDRLDPKRLSDDRLTEAYESASALRDDRRTARFAAELVRRNTPGLTRSAQPTLFATLIREAMRAEDPAQALEWLDRAKGLDGGRDRRTYEIWAAEIHAADRRP